MQTLSNGYQKPQSGDRGTSLFTSLEDDIQRLNDHTHDGSNSNRLSGTSIIGVKQDIAASWTAGSNGLYTQDITMPALITFDDYGMSFRLADGSHVFPTVERLSSTSYRLYLNDNTLAMKVVYTN